VHAAKTAAQEILGHNAELLEYRSYLFEYLPGAATVEAVEALLPWNLKAILNARERDL
jgi:hypothetical protein